MTPDGDGSPFGRRLRRWVAAGGLLRLAAAAPLLLLWLLRLLGVPRILVLGLGLLPLSGALRLPSAGLRATRGGVGALQPQGVETLRERLVEGAALGHHGAALVLGLGLGLSGGGGLRVALEFGLRLDFRLGLGLGFVVELFLVLQALGKGELEVCLLVLVVGFGGLGEYLGGGAVVGVKEAPALGSRALLGAGAGGGEGAKESNGAGEPEECGGCPAA